MNRDGFLTVNELLTSPEEYQFGSPNNWTNELDGLRCYAPNPESSILNEWPFITENSILRFSKIFSKHVLVTVLKTSLTNTFGWEPILSKKIVTVSTMTE